jgi:hypothetical protein
MWMKFETDEVSNWQGDMIRDWSDAGHITSVFMLNGRLYVTQGNGTSYTSTLAIIDFATDSAKGWISDSGDSSYGYQNSVGNISQRNNNACWPGGNGTSGLALVNGRANDVHAAVINGKTYAAVATDGGVSVINETDGTVTSHTNTYGVNKVFLAGKDLYYGWKTYHIVNYYRDIPNNALFSPGSWSVADAKYTAADSWWTPELYIRGTYSGAPITDLFVTQGTSAIDSESNTVYIGNSYGLSVIQEKQGDYTNGSVKYFTKDYISEEMIGDIRGMWTLENVNDKSVKANHLTNNGSATFTASGVRGKCATFDGTNHLSIVNNDGLNPGTGSFTVGAWIKTSSAPDNMILGKDGAADYLYFINGGVVQLHLEDDQGHGNSYTLSTSNPADGNWHHVAFVIDRTAKQLYGYFDGERQIGPLDISAITGTISNTADLSIGDGWWIKNKFVGQIDEVFMTAESLTPAQIKHIYQVGLAALNDGSDTANQLNGTSNTVNGVSVSIVYSEPYAYVGTAGGGVSKINLNRDTVETTYTTSTTPAINSDTVNAVSACEDNVLVAMNSGATGINYSTFEGNKAFTDTSATDGATPPVPTGFSLTANSSSQITLDWDDMTDNGTTYYYYETVADREGNENNIATNGDAELGTTTRWATDNYSGASTSMSVESSIKHSGNYSIKAYNTTGAGTGYVRYFYEGISLQAGKMYRASAWVKRTGSLTATMTQFNVVMAGSGNSWVMTPSAQHSGSGNWAGYYNYTNSYTYYNDWTYYSITFVPTGTITRVDWYLGGELNASTDIVYIDDVRLDEVKPVNVMTGIANYVVSGSTSTSPTASTYPHTGLSENTQYSYAVKSVDVAGNQSSNTSTLSKYTLCDTPTGLTATDRSYNSVTLSVDTFPNHSAGSSGYKFQNVTTGTIRDYVGGTNTWTDSTSINGNTQYTYRVWYRNGDATATTYQEITIRTKPAPANAVCDKSTSTWYQGDKTIERFNFTSTNLGTTIAYYRYIWDRAPITTVTGTDTQWLSGTLSLTPANSNKMYLHVLPYNADGEPGTQANYGPYYFVETSRLLKHKKFFDDDGVLTPMN